MGWGKLGKSWNFRISFSRPGKSCKSSIVVESSLYKLNLALTLSLNGKKVNGS